MKMWKLRSVYDVNLLLSGRIEGKKIPDMIMYARNTDGFVQYGNTWLKYNSDQDWEIRDYPADESTSLEDALNNIRNKDLRTLEDERN